MADLFMIYLVAVRLILMDHEFHPIMHSYLSVSGLTVNIER